MKYTLILFGLILLTSCKDSEQRNFRAYDKYARKAMIDYTDRDYTSALVNFERAFEVLPDESANDYFHAASCALHMNELEKAKSFIIDAIELKNAHPSYFKNFEGFDPFRDLDLFDEIGRDYISHQATYRAQLKCPEIDQEMDLLRDRDQKVREEGVPGLTMREVDSLNIIELIKIVEKCGWQDKSWILLWHHRGSYKEGSWVWDYFKPLINTLIKRGEIRRDYWARYEDEYAMLNFGYQIYGTYQYNFSDYPVAHVGSVDERRDSLGMAPLWYHEKVYDTPIPDGYIYPSKD